MNEVALDALRRMRESLTTAIDALTEPEDKEACLGRMPMTTADRERAEEHADILRDLEQAIHPSYTDLRPVPYEPTPCDLPMTPRELTEYLSYKLDLIGRATVDGETPPSQRLALIKELYLQSRVQLTLFARWIADAG